MSSPQRIWWSLCATRCTKRCRARRASTGPCATPSGQHGPPTSTPLSTRSRCGSARSPAPSNHPSRRPGAHHEQPHRAPLEHVSALKRRGARAGAPVTPFARKAASELVGTAFLVTAVVGSGIAASRLSPQDVGLQLLENSLITGAALVALI